MDKQEKQRFITFMMEADVLRFGSFTTKSGRQTPYFINTGNYRTGGQIAQLGSFYAALVRESGVSFDALFGPAYKGIPLVTAAAGSLAREHGIDKPYFFNRKEAKDHGEGGSLVGYQPRPGDRVAIIEDVITAGTAMRESMAILAPLGCEARDVFISVDRCEVGQTPGKSAIMEVREAFGLTVHALVTVRDVYDYLTTHTDGTMLPAMREYMDRYCV